MKIGLVTGEFPPMQGGVGAFTQELGQAMAALGHEVHIISSRQARLAAKRKNWRDLLQPVDLTWGKLHPIANHWRWRDVGKVADIAVRYELDLLNIQYQAAAYSMWLPGINLAPWRWHGICPTVITFHDLRVPYIFPKAGKLREKAVAYMGQSSQGVITTNREDGREIAGHSPEKKIVIPIGSNIKTTPYNEPEINNLRQKYSVSKTGFLLGYFGFLHPSKGADYLVRALAGLDEKVHLLFIGGQAGASDSKIIEQYWGELKDTIARLDLESRVHWSGFLPDEAVSTHLYAADLMVMPYVDGVSLRRGTLMAILAHGRPLITTEPDPPVMEIEHGKNCWLVSARDIKGLSKGIEMLRENAGIRLQLGAGAKEVAEKFTWPKIAKQTAAFYERVLRKR